ncbi:LuxR family transcriptional regulator [Mesorhizobium sp. J18]|uniref:helix-turn-helix transcriptional regulator n=1 Tax=Mesorhizobium sp. J18 TaxID=935263 RepID=UPI001199680B|nr:LuxR family transcriptional regulator [Mesorhizobium sp. J18]TWG91970.1 LuxR family transcriptional regulator [Mesorhizobium sp. J18]
MPDDMLFSLSQTVSAISRADCREALTASVLKGVQHFGFESFTLNINVRDAYEANANPVLTTHADSFHLEYDSLKLYELDPVLLCGLHADQPFCWNSEVDHVTPTSNKLVEMFRAMPLINGLVVPLPSSEGRSSLINLATSRDICISEGVVHSISIIAHTAMIKAESLGVVSEDVSGRFADANLSHRQIEILHWAARGKSNNDIATIMQLSRRTVDWHMSEVLRRLKVASRSQAVALLHGRPPSR